MTPEQRTAVLAAASSWLGTPFHHAARVKGAGVDCMQFIAAVYSEAKVIPPVEIRADYAPDWFMHRTEEKILDGIGRYFERVLYPSPGDLVLFRFGRAVSHAAIAIDWPTVIHAVAEQSVIRQNVLNAPRYARALDGFWTVRADLEVA